MRNYKNGFSLNKMMIIDQHSRGLSSSGDKLGCSMTRRFLITPRSVTRELQFLSRKVFVGTSFIRFVDSFADRVL